MSPYDTACIIEDMAKTALEKFKEAIAEAAVKFPEMDEADRLMIFLSALNDETDQLDDQINNAMPDDEDESDDAADE